MYRERGATYVFRASAFAFIIFLIQHQHHRIPPLWEDLALSRCEEREPGGGGRSRERDRT